MANEIFRGDLPQRPKRNGTATQFERRSEALRENLRKRKQQARERAVRAEAPGVRRDDSAHE